MVEFALIAPVFLALILGVIEIGAALDMQNSLQAGLREGGRLATMDWKETLPQGTTINQKVTNDVKNFLAAAGLPADKITVSITSAEGSDMGQTFDLSKASNNGRLFRISAALPYKDGTKIPASYMKNKTLEPGLVFRAGRTNLSN